MNRRGRKKSARRLVTAALLGRADEVRTLLRSGADPNAPDPDGTTPLYQASVQGGTEIVRLLLAAGADPDTESGHGSEGTPLCAAACWGHTPTVRALLTGGADPSLREDGGMGLTPLEWARRGPCPETVAVLEAAAGGRLQG
ncbi:ankyrin repeat domain-containing protein [Streptomyces sp. NPDC006458]|uniref:ankyrin repeat domain-containing protein n=1 Tax=Streptomyces sp. NPDC006458 TaxID=3154302 RepID=UPI0033B52307